MCVYVCVCVCVWLCAYVCVSVLVRVCVVKPTEIMRNGTRRRNEKQYPTGLW